MYLDVSKLEGFDSTEYIDSVGSYDPDSDKDADIEFGSDSVLTGGDEIECGVECGVECIGGDIDGR